MVSHKSMKFIYLNLKTKKEAEEKKKKGMENNREITKDRMEGEKEGQLVKLHFPLSFISSLQQCL